jgi:hypothetical protein
LAEFYGHKAEEDTADLVDRRLQERVWAWFTKHADVWVGREREANHLTLAEVEALDGSQTDGTTSQQDQQDASQQEQPSSKTSKLRIYTTQERVWHAVAGHGVDYKKVPRLEFQLLALIAAAGPNGILQPDLRALSGQDKRSVPKRTDALVEKGYIQKKPVYARLTLANAGGTKTSLCVHVRYLKKDDPIAEAPPEQQQADGQPQNNSKLFVNNSLVLENFIDAVLPLLEDFKPVAIDDLKHQLVIRSPLSRLLFQASANVLVRLGHKFAGRRRM